MEMLFIKCPVTGNPEPTGYTTTINSNLNEIDLNHTPCIQCGHIHYWEGSDAFFLTKKD
jgi:hypothetical protein